MRHPTVNTLIFTFLAATVALVTVAAVLAEDASVVLVAIAVAATAGGLSLAVLRTRGNAGTTLDRVRELEHELGSVARSVRPLQRRTREQRADHEQEAERLIQTRQLLDKERSRHDDTRQELARIRDEGKQLRRDFEDLARRTGQVVEEVLPLAEPTPGSSVGPEDFGMQVTRRVPAEFAESAAVDWVYDNGAPEPDLHTNPYTAVPRPELIESLVGQEKWRYHHGIAELIEHGDIYEAYARRIDTMLGLCDRALSEVGMTELADKTGADLASSEGFVAQHYLAQGLDSIDCFELSMPGIQRHLAVQALQGTSRARIGRMDLELADWSAALGSYDIVFALGIVYHLENPALFARNLFEITKDVALVESDTPNFPMNVRFRGNGVIYLNRDQVTLDEGSVRHLTEMRPDRVALTQLLLSAGFEEVAVVEPEGDQSGYFGAGSKSLLRCSRSKQ